MAILVGDVVGYSRLMELDEVGTLARLKAHRLELIDPSIAKNSGRMIKTTGDGILVEFASVVDAVMCGLDASCTDHTLVYVEVFAGQDSFGVDPQDWYAPEGAFPSNPMP